MDLIRTACDSNVIILCLPANTTHLLQPLDIGVFGPLKTVWRSILNRYKLETRGEMVSEEIFPSPVAQLSDISFESDHCKGFFCRTGLVPFFQKHVIDKITPPDTAVSRKEAVSTNSMIHSTTDQRGSSMVKCANCGKEMAVTPIIKSDIIAHFTWLLKVDKVRSARGTSLS